MKLIEQSHEILFIPDNPLQMIELAGRTCYKSEDKITDGSAEKFVKMLRDRGHHAMLEFGVIIVRFITNRGVTHELVRHRLCSFAQESTRYVNYGGKDMEFIFPVWLKNNCITESYTNGKGSNWSSCNKRCKERDCVAFICSLINAEADYNMLIGRNWKPQQAREVLPNALKTEIVVQANLREWRHIFKLRCSNAAHPQMSALMRPLLKEVQAKIPVLYDDIIY